MIQLTYSLFLSISIANNAHDRLFALTDIVEQRTVGGTGELARATLYTTHDIFLLGTFPLLEGRELG